MFDSKKSTDECYKNKQTFERCNICSCPIPYTCIWYMYVCAYGINQAYGTEQLP